MVARICVHRRPARRRCRRGLESLCAAVPSRTSGVATLMISLTLQALLTLAFSSPSNAPYAGITHAAFVVYQAAAYAIFNLLHLIRSAWDSTTPTMVASLEVQRDGVAQLLQREVVGTFACHVSLAQPGTLILSSRVRRQVCPHVFFYERLHAADCSVSAPG